MSKGYVGAYIGIDVAGEAMKEMQKKYGGGRIQYEVGDAYELKFEDNVFDYCVLGEVLEHCHVPGLAIQEALRVLRPGGTLAISVPNNEAIEPGAVDGARHVFSYQLQDFKDLSAGLGRVVGHKVLGSKWFPRYVYCFKQLIVFIKKYGV